MGSSRKSHFDPVATASVLTRNAPLQGAEIFFGAIQGWRPDKSGLTPG